MKRFSVIIGIVIGVAATPTVVVASDSDQSRGSSGRYELSRTWNTQLGQLYGPVQVGPSSYGFLSK